MNNIQILSNQHFPIGKIINQVLQHSQNTQIAVAFLKFSGIKVIDYALKHSLEKGGHFELIAGLDFKTTDPKSMHYFLQLKKNYPNVKFYCYGDRKQNKTDTVFHPKIYLFENPKEKTSIIGSTNLTQGGLLTNLEVNTVFTEQKPIYFSQLQAIYNAIKYTDSVFVPDEEYIYQYGDIFSTYAKKDSDIFKDKSVSKVIQDIKKRSLNLEGTIPSTKKIIIQYLSKKSAQGVNQASLQEITEYVFKFIAQNGFENHFKMDTLKNSIRGELNHNEESGKETKRNLKLFKRIEKGVYTLTQSGKTYSGR